MCMPVPSTLRYENFCLQQIDQQTPDFCGRCSIRIIHLISIPVSIITTLFDSIVGCVPCTDPHNLRTSDSLLLRPVVSIIKMLNPDAEMGEQWTNNPNLKQNITHGTGIQKEDYLKMRDRIKWDAIRGGERCGPVMGIAGAMIGKAIDFSQASNFFVKHVISRTLGLLGGIALIIGNIVDPILGLIAAGAAIISAFATMVSAGYWEWKGVNAFVVTNMPGSRNLVHLGIGIYLTVLGAIAPSKID